MPHSSLCTRTLLRTRPGGAWNYDNVAPYVSTRSYVPAPSPHRPSTAAPAYLPGAGLGIMTMLPHMYPHAPTYLHPRHTDHPLPLLRTCTLAPTTTHCRPCVPARAGLGIMTMLPPMYPHAPTYLHPRPTDHLLPLLRTCPGGAWN